MKAALWASQSEMPVLYLATRATFFRPLPDLHAQGYSDSFALTLGLWHCRVINVCGVRLSVRLSTVPRLRCWCGIAAATPPSSLQQNPSIDWDLAQGQCPSGQGAVAQQPMPFSLVQTSSYSVLPHHVIIFIIFLFFSHPLRG